MIDGLILSSMNKIEDVGFQLFGIFEKSPKQKSGNCRWGRAAAGMIFIDRTAKKVIFQAASCVNTVIK